MSKLTLLPGHNHEALNDFAGNADQMAGWDPTILELEMEAIDQPTADQALIDYVADQANIDNGFIQSQAAQKIGELQQEFGNDVIINAVVEVMRTELNALRALHSLPDIAAGAMDGAVRAKIANP